MPFLHSLWSFLPPACTCRPLAAALPLQLGSLASAVQCTHPRDRSRVELLTRELQAWGPERGHTAGAR